MKTFSYALLLVAVALLSTACMSSYQSLSDNRLSSIPTPVQQQEVEVFFPGERPTDTAYVKISVLEQKVEGEVAYAQLVEQLRKKAQLEGMDALLLLGKNQSTRLKSDAGLLEVLVEIASGEEIEDSYSSVTTHELSGVGIKYKRNLRYLPDFIQRKRIFILEQGQDSLLATVTLDHEGMDKKVTLQHETAGPTYRRFVHDYNLNHLLKEQGPTWYYTAVAGQVQKRKLMSGDGSGALKTIKITYNAAQLPEKLEIRRPGLPQPEVLTISYNAQKQVTQKCLYRGKQLFLKETNTFDALGKLESTLHEKVQEGHSVPFLKTVYDYYSLLSFN
ncbi:hypothetical protein [Rufibacter latericius]|uniref:Uncharacterized protein n=1 Tax=Rufibacter latericius TaxID=2487040 RepID=A0A3M9MQK1_9BACT|nr:hypothetical protein [Rufibacter latericius]RNI26978.1 hypothetical protein EFB08_10970 [Rufibacter latericius]